MFSKSYLLQWILPNRNMSRLSESNYTIDSGISSERCSTKTGTTQGSREWLEIQSIDEAVQDELLDRLNCKLFQAAARGNADDVKAVLQEFDEKTHSVQEACKGALLTAADHGQHDVIKILLQCTDMKGLSEHEIKKIKSPVKETRRVEKLKHELLEAATSGQIKDVRSISTQCDVKSQHMQETCKSALIAAAEHCHHEVLEFLLQFTDVNSRCKHGSTPLHVAAAKGCVASVELLLHKGADVLLQTKHGWQPLHHAVLGNKLDACKVLLNSGATAAISTPSSNGWCPLHLGAAFGFPGTCEYLIDNGADINSRTLEGWTALHFAASYGHSEICKLLIKSECDVAATNDQYNMSALELAADAGQTECVTVLLDAVKHSYRSLTNLGLFYALFSGLEEIGRHLLTDGADIQAKDKGNTVLHISATNDRAVKTIKWAHEEGVDIFAKNDAGKTAKDVAEIYGSWKVHSFLSKLEIRLKVAYPVPVQANCRRGFLLVINNENYQGHTYPRRNGSDRDARSLVEVFTSLHFEATVATDLTFTSMAKTVWDFVHQPGIEQSTVVAIAILSHGNGNLVGVDGKYSFRTSDIVELVCSAPHLAGKPKFLLIQACRGARENDGIGLLGIGKPVYDCDPMLFDDERSNESGGSSNSLASVEPHNRLRRFRGDSTKEGISLTLSSDVAMRRAPRVLGMLGRISSTRPMIGDYISAESTVQDRQSYRDGSGKGSIFIQTFCKVLKQDAHKLCLLEMLTKVNMLVAERFEVPNGAKMQPVFSSALNGRLFLNPPDRQDYYYGIPINGSDSPAW